MNAHGHRPHQLIEALPNVENVKMMERKLKELDPVAQSIMASHIWWNLADHKTREEMATIKAMINYNIDAVSPEDVEQIMVEFGVERGYASTSVHSRKTQAAYSEIVRQREARKAIAAC